MQTAVSLAKQVDRATHAQRREKSSRKQRQQMARDMDLPTDSDDASVLPLRLKPNGLCRCASNQMASAAAPQTNRALGLFPHVLRRRLHRSLTLRSRDRDPPRSPFGRAIGTRLAHPSVALSGPASKDDDDEPSRDAGKLARRRAQQAKQAEGQKAQLAAALRKLSQPIGKSVA